MAFLAQSENLKLNRLRRSKCLFAILFPVAYPAGFPGLSPSQGVQRALKDKVAGLGSRRVWLEELVEGFPPKLQHLPLLPSCPLHECHLGV